MSTRQWRPWRRWRPDEDFHREIQAHLDIETDRLVAEGIEPEAARQAARRTFGNVGVTAERFYETNRWMWFEQLRQDARYAVRTLRRSPAFFATTVATLAIALALVTVVFAVFNAYVLRPFAIPDPYRVYQLAWQARDDHGGAIFTEREYLDVRQRHDLFEGVVAHRFQIVSAGGRPLYAAFVSGNYFDVLRPRLGLGRPLGESDSVQPGGAPVAVLSDQCWLTLFNRDPQVLGRTVELHGQRITIIGVVRPEFAGLDDLGLDLWIPLTMLPVMAAGEGSAIADRRELTLFARLRQDVTAAQAEQALAHFMTAAAAAEPSPARPAVTAVRASLRLRATPNPLTFGLVALLSPIFAAFGLVLFAACANVSSVMLARALNRQREIGIRLSIGASRGRIVRQLLTEAAIVAGLAGAVGLAISSIVLPAGRWLFFRTMPPTLAELVRVAPLEIDVRVFGFAFVVAGVATLLCALVPALQASRPHLTSAMRGEFGPKLRGGSLRNVLVCGQITVSLILVVAAATLARNGATVAATDLGFEPHGVFSINQRGAGAELISPAAAVLVRSPHVDTVAVTNSNPLFGGLGGVAVVPSGRVESLHTSYMFVSPEYFPLLRIPLLRGRSFTEVESRDEARVAIVSARAARLFWPDGDAIGQALRIVATPEGQNDALAGYTTIAVVGVAKDVVTGVPYEGTDPALVYLPTSRSGAHAGAILARVRATGATERTALQDLLERAVRRTSVFEVIPLAEMSEILLYPLRMASWIGSVLSLLALVLSVCGLYGLLMYTLSHRTREIGIRMALGATANDVVRLIARESARVVVIGGGAGLVFTYVVLKVLDATVTLRLGNVSILDAWAFAAGALVVSAAAIVASYFPARRAALVDPSTTLRAEG